MKERKWEGTTYGSERLHRLLIAWLRWADVRLLYVLSAVFVVPVVMAKNPSTGVSYRYFRRRHHYSRLKSCFEAYVNHCLFAQAIIDRFAMYAGKTFKCEMVGYEHYSVLEGRPEGFVQLASHAGNYEIAGYTLVARNKPMNALVYGGEKESVMIERGRQLSKDNIRVISANEDLSHVFELNSALAAGEVVSIHGDRVALSQKSVEVELLGAKARLPVGPFLTATSRGLNAIAVNVMKVGAKKYEIRVSPLPYDREAGRNERVAQLASAYAAELEKALKDHPAQWYNFYEFWN